MNMADKTKKDAWQTHRKKYGNLYDLQANHNQHYFQILFIFRLQPMLMMGIMQISALLSAISVWLLLVIGQKLLC